MEKRQVTSRKIYLLIGALITWFAVVFQFFLIIANRVMPVLDTIIRFFSFFTILTNIMVAVCFSFLLVSPKSRWREFFERQTVLTAITVYITVVGLVYNLILRHLWEPAGLQLLVDELLHSVVPVLFIIYWLLFVRKDQLKWKDVLPWLLYPFVYLIYILARGALSEQYPYPFIDVKQHGYSTVIRNSGLLFLSFLLLSLVFVATGKIMSRNSR